METVGGPTAARRTAARSDAVLTKCQTTQLYKLFMAHPELNVSAIARRLGISQSLMAQYISGKKKASDERITLILNTVREIGQELIAV